MFKLKQLFFALSMLFGLSSCGVIPGSGPFNGDTGDEAELSISIENNAYGDKEELKFVLVNSTKLLIDHLSVLVQNEKFVWPSLEIPAPVKINKGDSLDITIYESKSGGLFIPQEAGVRPGNFITLPAQIVDSSGEITVPYVGTFNVVGLTLTQVKNHIVQNLGNRAIEPQVIVSYGNRDGSKFSVIGDVNQAAKFPLSFGGDTILDGIARAGGPKFAGYDTLVTLQRSHKETTIALDELIQDPAKNIYLEPDDIVYLIKQPNTYTVYGAANGNGRYELGRRKLFLSEALGNTGGLNHLQADASEVFVFRYLKRDIINNLLSLENPGGKPLQKFDEQVPTVFRFNLREPAGFFYAQNFPVSNNDVIYIPDADTVDLNKFISTLLAPATSTSVNVKTLRN